MAPWDRLACGVAGRDAQDGVVEGRKWRGRFKMAENDVGRTWPSSRKAVGSKSVAEKKEGCGRNVFVFAKKDFPFFLFKYPRYHN